MITLSSSQYRRLLLGSALVDGECARLLSTTRPEAWPEAGPRALRDAIAARVEAGEPVDVVIALEPTVLTAGLTPGLVAALTRDWAAPGLVRSLRRGRRG